MNVEQFVGMTIEAARTLAYQGGFKIHEEVSGVQVLSNDFQPGRLNLKVSNGIVVSAHVG